MNGLTNPSAQPVVQAFFCNQLDNSMAKLYQAKTVPPKRITNWMIISLLDIGENLY